MPKSEFKKISGKEISEILIKKFGFEKRSQKGSHLKLKKGSISTIVPQHKEIKYGTFKGILELAKISEIDFYQKIK